MRWAAEQFQACLLEAPEAEAARVYLGERKLTGETVRKFGLGFAPGNGNWLVKQAALARMSADLLEMVGLIAKRTEDQSTYDRFRDRVMFPIRDVQGRTVGFGGRILPSSPFADRAPKYYNSSETPLFSKSEQLYGIDHARQAATKSGYLAIVEGYTDVLMAHQCGIAHVVATMGTALNARHVGQLRRLAQRVVLVFDADAGGDTGVDRAIEVFVSNDIDLRIAGLPAGLDPCDLLSAQGPEPFRQALEQAVEVLEFKLHARLGPRGAERSGRTTARGRATADAPGRRSRRAFGEAGTDDQSDCPSAQSQGGESMDAIQGIALPAERRRRRRRRTHRRKRPCRRQRRRLAMRCSSWKCCWLIPSWSPGACRGQTRRTGARRPTPPVGVPVSAGGRRRAT